MVFQLSKVIQVSPSPYPLRKLMKQLIRSLYNNSPSFQKPIPVFSENQLKSRLQKLRENELLPFSAFLTDTFGRQHNYLRISVTERCNLRCTYCMPEEGVPLTPTLKLLTESEIVRLGKLFIGQGVDKIRFTGGEPLIRKELSSIIGQLSELNLTSIGITTNGILLPRYLSELVTNGVTHINVSLDSLNPKLFEKISRRPSMAWFKVWKGIELAQLSPLKELKLNVVVMKGTNEHEICDFVELTKDRKINVRFIEYMPFSGNKWDLSKMVSYQEMVAIIKEKYPEIEKLQDSVNHTAKAYQVPGYLGKFGFITSMSDHFCGGCNRLRITADGNLKVCLFGNAEVSLRDAIRSGMTDDELLSVIGNGVKRKHAKHAGMMNLSKMENRPMILIGTQASFQPGTIWPQIQRLIGSSFSRNRISISERIILSCRSLQKRMFCSKCQEREGPSPPVSNGLTHVDVEGKVKMVDVSEKKVTTREAIAVGSVVLSDEAFRAVLENKLKKGDVLTVSQIAGIMGGKQTSSLIPLCHPLPLSQIHVELRLEPGTNSIRIQSLAKTTSNTGVEMEALTAVAIAALTVYDMCKAIDKGIIITEIKLLKKTGGKSDYNNAK